MLLEDLPATDKHLKDTMVASTGSSVPIRASCIGDLTVSLLETDPRRYFRILEGFASSDDRGVREALRKKLNEAPYESYHSNHVLSLCRLVGRMNQRAIDTFGVGGSFYGSKNIDGIPVDLAMDLMRLMLVCGGDISARDYYDTTAVGILEAGEEESNFYRTGADEYLNFVRNLSGSCDINEGIPPESSR